MEKEKKSRCPGAAALFAEYKKLSDKEQRVFFNKVFASALHGSDKELKKEIKDAFAAIWEKIEVFQQGQKAIETFADVPTEVLKKVLASRKK